MSVLDAKPNTTVAFTDGACKGNPGVGGWGTYLVFADGRTQALCGGETHTTNNCMELMGAISALQHSPSDQRLEIWTDSNYVKNGITKWIHGWKQKGWQTASKKPVANKALWQQLDALCQSRQVDWFWVKGHAGHAGNEKADELANLGVEQTLKGNGSAKSMSTDTNTSIDDSVNSTVTHDAPSKRTSVFDKGRVFDKNSASNTPQQPAVLEDKNIASTNNHISNNNINKNNVMNNHNDDNTHPSSDWMDNDILGFNAIDTEDDIELEDIESEDIELLEDELNEVELEASKSLTGNEENEVDVTNLPEFDGDTSRANPHFRPILPTPKNRHETDRQLIMDTETTGLDPNKGDRIIEVGIVELVGRKPTGEKLHVYINPERGMDEEVIRIHGISEAFLADKPTFAQVAKPLYDFMQGAELIAHNAPFDMGFLSAEFNKIGITDFANQVRVTDSLTLAKQQYPGQKNTLDALVRRLNVGKQDRTFHGALLDAEILAEVYLAMTGGQVSLAIDEEITSTHGGGHINFAHLADQLISSPTDEKAHQQWMSKLGEQYPDLHTQWG